MSWPKGGENSACDPPPRRSGKDLVDHRDLRRMNGPFSRKPILCAAEWRPVVFQILPLQARGINGISACGSTSRDQSGTCIQQFNLSFRPCNPHIGGEIFRPKSKSGHPRATCGDRKCIDDRDW